MDKKSRFGRFTWLLLLATGLTGATIPSLATASIANGFLWIGAYFLGIPFWALGIYLHNKASASDQKNNISPEPLKNLLLPWPKPAIGLALLFIVELLIATPLLSYSFDACGNFDLIRKANGCLGKIPQNSSVINMVFSKDGKLFATSDIESAVKIWSYPDLTLVNTIKSDWRHLQQLALSSNGEMLAICGDGYPIRVLETRTGKVLYTATQKDDRYCQNILFTTNDKSVIAMSSEGLKTWNVASGNLIDDTIGKSNQIYFAISSDGDLQASLTIGSSKIEIHRVSDHSNITLQPQSSDPKSVNYAYATFSHDGKYLYAARQDSREPRTDPSNYMVIIDSWNVTTAKIEHTISLHDAQVLSMASSPNSHAFAVGIGSSCANKGILFETPCTYFIPSAESGQMISLRIPYGSEVLAFSPIDNKLLISSFKNVYIWQVP